MSTFGLGDATGAAQASWWCELGVIDGRVASGLTITARADTPTGPLRIVDLQTDTMAPPGSHRLGGLTVAGFANTHSHAFHRALRSRTQVDRGTFWTWREVMYSAAQRLDPDSYHRLARAVFAEMAATGMAAVGEFHYVHHQPDGTPYRDPNAMGEALMAAAGDAGIRITLLDTMYLASGVGYDEPTGVQQRFADTDAAAWVDRVDALRSRPTQDHARIGAAIHSVRAADPAAIAQAVAWTEASSAPLHAHVSEQPLENEQCLEFHGHTPTALLAKLGVLGDRFTAIHATHLSDHDIAMLAESGSGVCICPTTERDLGDGIGPTTELSAAGVALSLGSDSHAVIDHLAEARALEMNERLRSLARGAHTATELLAMATTHGHRSLGWDDAGAIEVGNRADLTTISLTSPRTAGSPPGLAVEAAVFAASASDVTSVIVDGRTVAAGGRHRSIDVAAELTAAIEELFS